MRKLIILTLMLVLAPPPVSADQYWIAYEGNELPENVGWTRYWGNWQGPKKGEAKRTLKDGVLTMNTLHDPGVYDFAEIRRPGKLDPKPGETFVMEWRLRVEKVVGVYGTGVVVFSDEARGTSFNYATGVITSGFEPGMRIVITPGVFHSYRIESRDMSSYSLYIDGGLRHRGVFVQSVGPSQVAWGEGVQGYASLDHWDYFRFGVIPEPASALMLLVVVTGRRLLRR